MRIGAKAKVVDWLSVYSGEVVNLIEETDNEYIFANEKHKRGTLTVNKSLAHGFIVWESGEDDEEIN